jgi:hypothetical protein
MSASDPLALIEAALRRQPEGLSLRELQALLPGSPSQRTLSRRVSGLVNAGRIRRIGRGPSSRYTSLADALEVADKPPRQDGPEEPDLLNLSDDGRAVLAYVSKPVQARSPRGYDRSLLQRYLPRTTEYLPQTLKDHLHQIGKPIAAARAAGTFARDILSRFLIDLSWASSRLEGNTYSRLDTERLIQFGQEAEGKDAKETQMILNHKAAIELLVDGNLDEVGVNRFTLLNLHALLAENLMADPEAAGRLRVRPVDIGGSVYTPLAIPQLIEELFDTITLKAGAIADPFECAFFLMVHLPYLQPFEDVNKRVSRLAANIPLIKADLCPLSFVDVPSHAYVAGLLGVYELSRVELLRDVFVWAYERSCQRYVVVRDSTAEPDRFRMRYREALTEVIGEIVRGKKPVARDAVRAISEPIVEPRDVDAFVDMAVAELHRLREGNIARYRIRLSEYWAWRRELGEARPS